MFWRRMQSGGGGGRPRHLSTRRHPSTDDLNCNAAITPLSPSQQRVRARRVQARVRGRGDLWAAADPQGPDAQGAPAHRVPGAALASRPRPGQRGREIPPRLFFRSVFGAVCPSVVRKKPLSSPFVVVSSQERTFAGAAHAPSFPLRQPSLCPSSHTNTKHA